MLFCSVSSQPTRHIRHILPAASRYRNILFCAVPVNSSPAYALLPTDCRKAVSLFCSASFRPTAPPQSIRPTLPAASQCHNVLFCAVPFNSILACAQFRLTAAKPCRSILLCFIPVCQPPQSTRPTLPAASRCRNVLCCAVQFQSGLRPIPTDGRKPVPFCSAPFNSVTVCVHLPTVCRQAVPFYSALFHSGQSCYTLPAASPHCTEADLFSSSITTKNTYTAY